MDVDRNAVVFEPRGRARGPWVATGLLMALAVALGIYGDVGQRVDGLAGALPQLGTPWVLLAFAGGAVWSRRPVVAAMSGALLILIGLASYFLFMNLFHGVWFYNLLNDGRGWYWFSLAAVLGLAVGLGGALTGAGGGSVRQCVAWGLAAAVPAAEGIFVLNYDIGPAPDVLAVLLAVASLPLLAVGWRVTRKPWVLLVAASAWVTLGAVAGHLVVAVR